MAARIHEVKQARADLENEIHRLKTEGRALSARGSEADQTRLAAIDAALDAKHAELGTVLKELALVERDQERERAEGHAAFLANGGDARSLLDRPRGRTYAEMFPRAAISMGGWDSGEQFLATIHNGLSDPRLVSVGSASGLQATNTIGVPSDGGFSVPTELFRQWLDTSLESEVVRSRADVFPMTSSSGHAPGWDDGDHSSDTLYGGFTGQWIDEAGDITVQTPKLRLIDMHARKLAILARVSNELIADGVGFEAQLGGAITKALGWFLDKAFLSGNGAAKPLGVFNSAATITVAKETSQTAATINYTNISKMFARLAPSSYQNAVWVCNTTAIPQLLTLVLPIGTAGSHIPVLSDTGGSWRMLTRPVIFTEKAPALGTVGDIGLYDFSQYAIGMRADFTLAKSGHAGFSTDTSYYRGIVRLDGQPKLAAPITPAAGDTLSPFVVLATRA